MLDVEVEGEMSPEGPIACGTSQESSKAENGFGRFVECVLTMSSSVGGDSVPVGNGMTEAGSLAASSAVVGFSGRFWRRFEDESSESMAK